MDFFASLVDRDFLSTAPAFDAVNATQGTKHGGHSENGRRMFIAWIALQLAGQATLPILVLTFLFHKRISRRNPTVINLCIVWIIATIPPELLFYANKWSNEQPNPFLCLLQAATIAAVPPMAAMAYLSVVIHACFVIHEIMNESVPRPFTVNLRMIVLLSAPYLTFLIFALFVASIGAQNAKDVRRTLFFCVVLNHNLSIPVLSSAVGLVVITLIFQVWIAIALYRDRAARRRRKLSKGHTMITRDASPVDIRFMLRMVGFTAFEVIIVISCVASMADPHMAAAPLLLATPPFAVFLIFASSKDIFCAWFPCFVRRRDVSPTKQTESTNALTGARESAPPSPRQSLNINPRPLSTESHYSQQSAHPTAHRALPGARLAPPGTNLDSIRIEKEKSHDVDLEKGLSAPLRVYIPPRRPGMAEPIQEHTTTTIIHNSPGQGSALTAMRSMRASPTGQRGKSRFTQI